MLFLCKVVLPLAKFMYVCMYVCMYVYMYVCLHKHTETRRYRHRHTHSAPPPHTCAPPHTHTHVCPPTHTRVPTHTHTHTCAPPHTHPLTTVCMGDDKHPAIVTFRYEPLLRSHPPRYQHGSHVINHQYFIDWNTATRPITDCRATWVEYRKPHHPPGHELFLQTCKMCKKYGEKKSGVTNVVRDGGSLIAAKHDGVIKWCFF